MTDRAIEFAYDFLIGRRAAAGEVATEVAGVLEGAGYRVKPNFDSGFGKAVSDQQLMRPRLAFSITGDELRLRGGQSATVSRMLGGRAIPVALNRGPMVPVAGVRRVMR
jgi:hypothetical protein